MLHDVLQKHQLTFLDDLKREGRIRSQEGRLERNPAFNPFDILYLTGRNELGVLADYHIHDR